MTTDFTARKERFLNAFFGGGNQLTREALRGSPTLVAANARHWEETLRTEQDIVVLPRRQGGEFFWYAIAFNERTLRELREQLSAFVGPSYSDFHGERYQLHANDPVEVAIIEFAGNHAFRFQTTLALGSREELARILDRMWAVLQSSAPRLPQDDRSVGRVLRDFYLALAAGNRPYAETCLRLLRTDSRLDILNLQFLKIQLRSELGFWQEILEFPDFSDLLKVRRPVAVSRALLTAVYRVKLAAFEISNRPKEAVRVFREEIAPQSGTLYQSRLGLQEPDIVKSFLLAAVATEAPLNVYEELLAIPGLSPEDVTYMHQVIAVAETAAIRSPEPIDPLFAAQEAILRLDWNGAAALATTVGASIERAKILLRCAYELPSSHIERMTVEAVASLSLDQRGQLLQSRLDREVLRRLTGTEDITDLASTVPGNWTEWLVRSCDPTWRRSGEIAMSGSLEWAVQSYADHPETLQELIEGVERTAQDQTGLERLRDGLPHLVRAFEADPDFPRPSFRSLYDTLRMALVYYGSTGSLSEWQVFNDLAEAALSLGANAGQYSNLVEEAISLWETHGAPSNLRAALDFLDILLYYPCPLTERQRYGSVVLSKAALWAQGRRVDRETLLYVAQLAAEIGLTELVFLPALSHPTDIDQAGDLDPLTVLSGRIAIYTLTETVGHRIERLLHVRCPQCTIKTNSDKVCTSQLQELAESARIFVIVTSSAKHAATQCIEAHRPTDLPILRPAGKGTSSILFELAEYATGLLG